MEVANDGAPKNGARFARVAFFTVAWLLAAVLAVAQDAAQSERTGVAKPQPVTTTDDTDAPAAPPTEILADPAQPKPAQPSAAVPMGQPTSDTAYGPYVPYRGGNSAADGTAAGVSAAPFDPDANIVTDATAGRRPLSDATTSPDADAGIVTHVPWPSNAVPEGALLKVKLLETISTETTKPGTPFTAELTEPVIGDGRLYLPAGSVLKGRVTWASGGSRISGGAAIHLETRTITLPDGTEYPLHARVIDTNSWENTKVDSEGTITRREHPKQTLATVGLATGGGAAAGAMIAGVPGALIGAGVGAGVSAVVWLKQDRQAMLPKELGVVFSLTTPMRIVPEKVSAGPGAE
jgi:hypothetical protein